MAKREWNVTVRKDGGAVRVYRWGKLQEELKPGKDTYDMPAGAMKFAEELHQELAKFSSRKVADHDVQSEKNLKNEATGAAVTGKPSPTTSDMADKVARLQSDLKKKDAQLRQERRRHALEVKARRGAKLAEILVKRGALPETEKDVRAFVKDVAMMSDDEIARLEHKAAGDPEFASVEEAERAERAYKREARILIRKAEEAHESGDTAAADKLDAAGDDATKNAACCRAFIRSAVHKGAMDTCKGCGKPSFVCDGSCAKPEAGKADGKGEEKGASVEAKADEKTADHDVQDEKNLKNDPKGVAVTGKPSPSTNTKASDEGQKKTGAKCESCSCDPCGEDCHCAACKKASDEGKKASGEVAEKETPEAASDPLETLRAQHVATAKMYRKMADDAEERGDFVAADTFDHKAEVCEDLAKDAAVERAEPEPELAGVGDTEIREASDATEREASEEASTEDTDGPSEGTAKTASTDELELTDDIIDAAVTPAEVHALRSAYSGQRRREPSRVDPKTSGVMRIANVDENAASHDEDVAALEGLWTRAPRE
jgi:hypothetical protein